MLSIIIACKNSFKTFLATIESIEKQENQDFFELVIVDASDNNEIQDFIFQTNNRNFHYFKSFDNSIYEAWNYGVKMAKGDTVFFLNSDDCLYNKVNLEKLYKQHLSKNVDITHGKILYHTVSGYSKVKGGALKPYRFVFGMDKTFLTLAALFNKDLFKKVGFFDTYYRISSDLDFIYKCLKLKDLLISFEPIVLVHMFDGGISSKRRRHGMKEFGRVIYNHESIVLYILFLFHEYLIRPLKKYLLFFIRR